MSAHPGDLPPLLGALLTQELALGLSSQTRRARSCSSNSSEQESAETRQHKVMLRPRPNNHDLRAAHSVCLPFFAGKLEDFGSLTKRPWHVSVNNKTVFQFVSHCPCPLPLNTFQMDLGHALMFGGYQLMNPRRCRPHRARSVSLKFPLDNFSQAFHTVFLFDVDALERFLCHFEMLRLLWVHSQQRFPHQRVGLLCSELVVCCGASNIF